MDYPNPNIEITIIAQALDMPGKFKIVLITHWVTTKFLNSLCTLISYTLTRNSIFGLGYYVKVFTKGHYKNEQC